MLARDKTVEDLCELYAEGCILSNDGIPRAQLGRPFFGGGSAVVSWYFVLQILAPLSSTRINEDGNGCSLRW